MTALQNLLTFLSKSPSTSIVLGLVLGAMVSVDMGGPVNKVAFLFGVASITAGTPEIIGSSCLCDCCTAIVSWHCDLIQVRIND